MKKISKAERIVRRRKIMLASVILIGFLVSAIGLKSNSVASASQEEYKYYKSIQVCAGDSLWSISEGFMTTDHNDRMEFIDEVRRLNHIGETEDIHAGEFLVVPYYSFEVL